MVDKEEAKLKALGLSHSYGLTDLELDRLIAFKKHILSLTPKDINKLGKKQLAKQDGYLDSTKSFLTLEDSLKSFPALKEIWVSISSPIKQMGKSGKYQHAGYDAVGETLKGLFYKGKISTERYNFFTKAWRETFGPI